MTARHKPNEMIEAMTASKGVVFHLLAFSLALNLLMLTGPLYMLQVYDRVIPSQSMPTLVALSVLILMLYATLGILEWVRTGLFSSAASRFEDRLSERVANASMDLALSEAGDILIPISEGRITEQDIVGEIGNVLLKIAPGRRDEQQITLYKSLGIVAQDLFAAMHVFRNARSSGKGQWVDFP